MKANTTMKTLSTILTLAATLTLTLGCDAEPEVDFGAGEVSLRPLGGFRLNTSFIGKFGWSELDIRTGNVHEGTKLHMVCIDPQVYGDELCLIPGLDDIWVDKGEIHGKKYGTVYKGLDLKNSEWHIEADSDGDGVLDSQFIAHVDDVKNTATAQGTPYWAYLWTYRSWEVVGPLAAKVEQSKSPQPFCEKDVDTGSLHSVANGRLHVDMATGDFSGDPDVVFLACFSGAVGKVQQDWGYVNYKIGRKKHELVTRVARADYCGDGTSYTEPGTAMQIEDKWGLNGFAVAELPTEAQWVVGGAAACLYEPRHPAVTYEMVETHCGIPTCEEFGVLGDWGDEVHTKVAF
ncbi:MAG TPA: hypothetical protein ENK31_03595 [Nannocystis exedens]|nr:hypothetical protein [Nannocystis exedens]